MKSEAVIPAGDVKAGCVAPLAASRVVLDPQSARVLGELDGPGVRPIHQMSPAGARRAMEMFVARWDVFPKPAVARIEELAVPAADPGVSLSARLYRPAAGVSGPLPLLLYFHGGGYVCGSLASHDSICRLLARDSGWLVLSVGYRLAPEYPFPTAHRDAYAATIWAFRNAAALGGDPGFLAVGGDGTGATLAAAVCQQARRKDAPSLRLQMLWYPQIGWASAAPSGGQNCFPNGALMQWSMAHYLQGSAQQSSPLLDPLRLADFRGLPPAFIMSAGFGPGRDASLLYAGKLRAAGIPVRYHCLESTIHGFLNMLGGIELAVQALAQSAAYMRNAAADGRSGASVRTLDPNVAYAASRRARKAAVIGSGSYE